MNFLLLYLDEYLYGVWLLGLFHALRRAAGIITLFIVVHRARNSLLTTLSFQAERKSVPTQLNGKCGYFTKIDLLRRIETKTIVA